MALKKAAGLVKLLALAPNHRVHRERTMDLLWPDLDPKAAANNLRHALHVARRTLEPSTATASPRYLVLGGELLELCPDVTLWVDVEAFERAVESARRARKPAAYGTALDLYAGDLLPEDRYEEWTEARREELRRLYLTSLVERRASCSVYGTRAGPTTDRQTAGRAHPPRGGGSGAGRARPNEPSDRPRDVGI